MVGLLSTHHARPTHEISDDASRPPGRPHPTSALALRSAPSGSPSDRDPDRAQALPAPNPPATTEGHARASGPAAQRSCSAPSLGVSPPPGTPHVRHRALIGPTVHPGEAPLRRRSLGSRLRPAQQAVALFGADRALPRWLAGRLRAG